MKQTFMCLSVYMGCEAVALIRYLGHKKQVAIKYVMLIIIQKQMLLFSDIFE